MRIRSPLRALAATTLLAASAIARADGGQPVIGPAQEPLLADLLGKGASLPGDCAWAGANVEQTRVVSSYTCAGAHVEIELHHPTDAPADAVRTLQFALQIKPAAPPPPGLVDALAERIRARESGFVWSLSRDHVAAGESTAPAASPRDPVLPGVLGALALTGLMAALMRLIYRRLQRATSSTAALGPRARLAAAALTVLVSAGLAAAVLGAARAFGAAVVVSLDRNAGAAVAASAVSMLACVALALGASALLARVPTRLPTWARFGAGPALVLLLGYPRSLVHDSAPSFGAVVVGSANHTWVDHRRDRPPVTYRTGALGFREPGWAPEKAPGTRRIALIGDSYVFGVGVERADTLSAALGAELAGRSPQRRDEIVNLGVPGSNLQSYVDVYEAADRLGLALDVVVICLTLPNDLSRWDSQVARRASAAIGTFSAARFVLGDAASTLWDLARLERAITPAGLSHLDEQLRRLGALRSASAHPPELLFYAFRDAPVEITSRLGAFAGARVVPPDQTFPDDFLVGDGHPTGTGNRRSARRIADTLEGH